MASLAVAMPLAAQDAFTIQSAVLAEPRPINVHVPASPLAPPGARLPVLYMPDGGLDEDFPHVVSAVDSLIGLGRIRPVIVVGIPNTQRRRDLTGPTRVASDSTIAPQVGGSALFRRFIREELFPEIDRRYRTTPERAIVGESLAGLFVLETFVEDRGMFTHYIALDPSVWWNAGALVETAISRPFPIDSVRRTLYLATSKEPSTSVGVGRLAEWLRGKSVVGVRWRWEDRPDLTHGNIFRSLEAIALTFALR
jgi:predicted alpha/beta superfamily hydrolase